jgi:hypothetical protein
MNRKNARRRDGHLPIELEWREWLCFNLPLVIFLMVGGGLGAGAVHASCALEVEAVGDYTLYYVSSLLSLMIFAINRIRTRLIHEIYSRSMELHK